MITKIDHIEIIVNDVKRHVEFYQKLGFSFSPGPTITAVPRKSSSPGRTSRL